MNKDAESLNSKWVIQTRDQVTGLQEQYEMLAEDGAKGCRKYWDDLCTLEVEEQALGNGSTSKRFWTTPGDGALV